MRLDKFLKTNRIIKRRKVANEMAKMGKIKKGDKTLKASYEVKPGDEITIEFYSKTIKILVLQDYTVKVLEERRKNNEME